MFFVVVAGVLCAPIFPVALRRLRSKWGGGSSFEVASECGVGATV